MLTYLTGIQRQARRAVFGAAIGWAAVAGTASAQSGMQPPILLGTSAAFSGPFAEYGEEFRKGADACLAVANAKGGVLGRQVQIEYMDDGYEPARTVTNARELASKGAVAFVNFVGTGGLQSLRPVMEQLQIPMIGNSSGANQVRDLSQQGSGWVYHSKASYGDEFEGLARLLPTIGLTKVALVYQDNPFGRAGFESARAAFSKPGATVASVPMGNELEKVGPAVTEVMKTRPQVVVLVAAGTLAPEFIAKYQEVAGPRARVAVMSVVGVRNLTTRLGEKIGGIITSTVYPSPWNTSRLLVREYQLAMARQNQPITLQSLEGCINLRLTLEALRAAGKNPTAQSVQQALQRGLKVDLGGFQLRLNPGSQVASTYAGLGIFRPNGTIVE
jgi:branched-chain amino acid transport system substrate-binding protein